MRLHYLVAAASIAVAPSLMAGQQAVLDQPGLDPQTIKNPLSDSWPTYSGDYTGRRFSALTQANQTTVKNLTLAWTARLTGGTAIPDRASWLAPRGCVRPPP